MRRSFVPTPPAPVRTMQASHTTRAARSGARQRYAGLPPAARCQRRPAHTHTAPLPLPSVARRHARIARFWWAALPSVEIPTRSSIWGWRSPAPCTIAQRCAHGCRACCLTARKSCRNTPTPAPESETICCDICTGWPQCQQECCRVMGLHAACVCMWRRQQANRLLCAELRQFRRTDSAGCAPAGFSSNLPLARKQQAARQRPDVHTPCA